MLVLEIGKKVLGYGFTFTFVDMTTPQAILLRASKLVFDYPGRALFKQFDCEIPAGVSLVLGGDGRGKTSLLQLLAAALPAQSGQLQLAGLYLHEQPDAYRRQVFWLDPRTDAFDQMTVPEFFSVQKNAYPAFDEASLPALIEGLGLAPHLEKKMYMLSTGSKRKVLLAAAFAANATLTLVDDPFASLDKSSIQFLTGLFQQMAGDTARAWVLAMYEIPPGLPLPVAVDLGD